MNSELDVMQCLALYLICKHIVQLSVHKVLKFLIKCSINVIINMQVGQTIKEKMHPLYRSQSKQFITVTNILYQGICRL